LLMGEYNEKRDQRYLSFRLISLVLYSVHLYNVTEDILLVYLGCNSEP
jgi:hypothetical protein